MGNEADLRDKSFDSRLAQIWEAAWRLWWLLACSAVARGGRSRGRREGAAAEVAPLTSTARRQSPPPPPTPACAPTAPRPLHPSLGADLVREPANRARQRQIDAGGASVRQCRMGSSGSTASDGSGRGHLHPCFLPPTTLSCHVAPPRHCPSAQLPARFHILPLHLEAADSRRDADITVAARPMDEKCATAFGLIKSNKEGRIIKFAEKPKGDQLKAMFKLS